jgi:pyruvate,water dikinase
MVYTGHAAAGRSVEAVDVPVAERQRFSISNAEAEELARYAIAIERHYQRPMDIEWGRDGVDGKLYILQARPETVKSQESGAERLRRFRLSKRSAVLASGRAIGQKIGQGTVRLIQSIAAAAMTSNTIRASTGRRRRSRAASRATSTTWPFIRPPAR